MLALHERKQTLAEEILSDSAEATRLDPQALLALGPVESLSARTCAQINLVTGHSVGDATQRAGASAASSELIVDALISKYGGQHARRR